MFLDKIWKNQPWWGKALLHLLLLRPIRGLPTFSPPKIWFGSKFKKIIQNDMILHCKFLPTIITTRWVAIGALFCNICLCFWPVRQSRAAVEPNLSLSQNTPISWCTYRYTWICIWRCVNRVTVFKFLVYWVNNMRRPLLYVISLCL